MLADLVRKERWEEMIAKLRPKHPAQSEEQIKDALGEAIKFYLEHPEKITGDVAEGLILGRAHKTLLHEWRHDKNNVPLDGKRERGPTEHIRVEHDIDTEQFIASLPAHKRKLFKLLLAGYSNDEIAERLGAKNNSTLRMRISRILNDFKNF